MAKIAALPVGQIIKGDFCGQYLYRWDNASWGICPGAKLENGWLTGNLYWHNDDYSQSGNWTGPKSADLVSESTVDHYEEIGSQTTGPKASAMLKGTLIGGIALGAIAGAASSSATTDVAFYLKNGRSFVVRFSNTQALLDLKSTLYSLEKQTQTSRESRQTSLQTLDAFEAIKKYKELLDMGIISQEEFEEKKNELIGTGKNNPALSTFSVPKENQTLVSTHETVDQEKDATELFDSERSMFVMHVSEVYWFKKWGSLVKGLVQNGTICDNDYVELLRDEKTIKQFTVNGITINNQIVHSAKEGDIICIVFRDTQRDEFLKGDQIVKP